MGNLAEPLTGSLLQHSVGSHVSVSSNEAEVHSRHVRSQQPPSNCSAACFASVQSGNRTWTAACQAECQACAICASLVTAAAPQDSLNLASAQYPAEVMTCGAQAPSTTQHMTCHDYDAVSAAVIGLYNSLPTDCNDLDCPQQEFAGCVTRLAGHDLMDYKDNEGGADACVDLQHPINRGLAQCLRGDGSGRPTVLNAYREFCGSISLADFVVIATEAVMSVLRQNFHQAYPSLWGSLEPFNPMDFRSSFRFGRTTAAECAWSESRMPNPENGSEIVRVLQENMGLDTASKTAIMGLHGIGRARVNNSGYDGWFVDAQKARQLGTHYYAAMVGQGFVAEVKVASNPGKNQWIRADVGRGRDRALGKNMMLNTDLCLLHGQNNAGSKVLNATSDAPCCAWAMPNDQIPNLKQLDGRYCGSKSRSNIMTIDGFGQQRSTCCTGNAEAPADCSLPRKPSGGAAAAVINFADQDTAWVGTFQSAWAHATGNVHGGSSITLRPLVC